ncbi:hypothetical protein Hamer_G029485 [Homarus americanus]|uniref:Uncharacterized protein n=1 Tax=Homarus americanus TaxID=6706 RepID=A0A8J5N703_HOMAM|nr:hypothetical protein Hamer_G029485 [Homarus americanus]
MWKNAITPESYKWAPEENGWLLENGRYVINWFEGQQVPEDVCLHIDDNVGTDMANEEEDETSTVPPLMSQIVALTNL